MSEILGLATVIFPTADLQASRTWWQQALGKEPYFDEPFYVGFDLNGYELGINPGAPIDNGPVTYLRTENIERAFSQFIDNGCTIVGGISAVGEGIRVGELRNPEGFVFGVIENPNFTK
ncbi:MAG: VOC family protein [Actinomycetota bacterium]|nr:VOC family protein [Actinomycetota bacterium]